MTITAVLSAIPLHLDKLDAAFNLGHTLAIRKGENDVHFFKKLSKNESLLFALESISLLGNTIFVAIKVEQKLGLLSLAIKFPEIILLPTLVAPTCVILASLGIVMLVNKVALRNIQLEENEHRPTKRTNELSVQFRHATRIVIQLAAICFAPTNPFILFSAVSEIYGLYKIAQGKWILLNAPSQEGFLSFPKTPYISVDSVSEKLRSIVIEHHLTGRNNFTISLAPVQTRPVSFQERWLRHLKRELKDKITWRLTALAIGVILVGISARANKAFFITKRTNWIGKPVHRYMDGRYMYTSIYTKSEFDSDVLEQNIVSYIICFLSSATLGISSINLKNHNGRLKGQQELISNIRSHPLMFDKLDCRELRNQTTGDNKWQDPITLDDLHKDQIFSPATLIIDKMAFSIESVLFQLFSHQEDQNNFLKPPDSEKLTLQHPFYRNLLNSVEQESIIDQICRTFMISSSDFINCWKLNPDQVPKVQLKYLLAWYQLKTGLSNEEMNLLPMNANVLAAFIQQNFPYEFHTFMKSEMATYFQLMRFHNFCKLLPKDIRKILRKNLSSEAVEKLVLIHELA